MLPTFPKRFLLCLACWPCLAAAAENDFEFRWRSYAQLTAERLEGAGGEHLDFGADRVRTRLEVEHGPLTGGIMLDFGVEDLGDRAPGALANAIGDLYANYRPNEKHLVRFGQFKTPLGMDFNIPGRSLDLTKRGMEAGLVLQRDVGLMLSGRRVVSGFGYDIGLFNPAGRSPATAHLGSQEGHANTPVVRLHYDVGDWHAEVARGRSDDAGGPGTRDYEIGDAGVSFNRKAWTAKAEWIEGRDIRGVADWDERVYYVHGAYRLTPTLELVARRYEGRSTVAGRATCLTNTYLGATKQPFSNARFEARLQVNYVTVGGDQADYTGLKAYRDNALLAQLQLQAVR
jgi:hypothetical protein